MMADEADATQERAEKEEALRRLFRPKNEIEANGFCHYCREPLQLPRKFCNAECSEGWEFEKRMRGLGK